MDWLLLEGGEWTRARIVTDSKSSLMGLRKIKMKNLDPLTADANNKLKALYRVGRQLTLTWTPSHCGLLGNEMADVGAAEAAKLDQQGARWPYAIAKARIKRTFEIRTLQHERAAAIYGRSGVRFDKETSWSKTEAKELLEIPFGPLRGIEELQEENRCG